MTLCCCSFSSVDDLYSLFPPLLFCPVSECSPMSYFSFSDFTQFHWLHMEYRASEALCHWAWFWAVILPHLRSFSPSSSSTTSSSGPVHSVSPLPCGWSSLVHFKMLLKWCCPQAFPGCGQLASTSSLLFGWWFWFLVLGTDGLWPTAGLQDVLQAPVDEGQWQCVWWTWPCPTPCFWWRQRTVLIWVFFFSHGLSETLIVLFLSSYFSVCRVLILFYTPI